MMVQKQKQFVIAIFLLFIVMLPNIIFIGVGEDSAVFTITKKIVFFIYTLSLVLFALSFIKPKVFFLLFLPLLPFALIDLYIIAITGTQSTEMHYYSFFATNLNEAVELIRGNITYVFLAVLYIGLFIFFLSKLKFSFHLSRKIRLFVGVISLAVITGILIRDFKIAYTTYKTDLLGITKYYFFVKLNKTFPVGTISKLEDIYQDVKEVNKFKENNVDFLYNPVLTNSDDQVIVLVIGETARRDNFQIYGYKRKTNPRLVEENNLIAFTKFTTCANFTLTSVSQIMSSVGPANYKDVYNELGLIAAFKEAGYKTYWITNQNYSVGSMYSLYSTSADVFKNVSKTLDVSNNDLVTLPVLDECLKDDINRKFIVIHSIGSHYRYNLRYPKEFARFKPEIDGSISIAENGVKYKSKYINSYDNSILFTDYFLSEIINRLKKDNELSIMMYLSDHGENLYDDKKELFLHGTPDPSAYELEIPMFVWYSDNYDQNVINRLNQVKDEKLSSEIVFHTLSDLGGFKTKLHNLKYDLLSDSLVVGERTFLKPDGSVMKID
ncbi:phosphoethanolamine transferase [Geofilum sp. OHC36d9]|uniref:phosphoethanolamine transferase n=1 Tax=Geofilum sp. OHC36d9 TaxID=3458413 RepID=UPI004033327A